MKKVKIWLKEWWALIVIISVTTLGIFAAARGCAITLDEKQRQKELRTQQMLDRCQCQCKHKENTDG